MTESCSTGRDAGATRQQSCEEVRMAALALLDGEPAELASDDIEAHAVGCSACRVALADLTALHAALGRVDYERLDIDLWPALRPQLALERPHGSPAERKAILGLTGLLVAWRLAQLLLDIPAPVINSVVPLAAVVFVLWRLAGDPFAVKLSLNQLEQKGAQ